MPHMQFHLWSPISSLSSTWCLISSSWFWSSSSVLLRSINTIQLKNSMIMLRCFGSVGRNSPRNTEAWRSITPTWFPFLWNWVPSSVGLISSRLKRKRITRLGWYSLWGWNSKHLEGFHCLFPIGMMIMQYTSMTSYTRPSVGHLEATFLQTELKAVKQHCSYTSKTRKWNAS